jgi:3-carboxy-cis,cis-muconate cycloisomerase
MSPSSSPSDDPFAFLTLTGPVPGLTSSRAWVAAVLEAEAALAAAQADEGVVPPAAADAVAAACAVERVDVAAIVEEAALGGNLVIPLLPRLRALVGDEHAGAVHLGATSQDMVDAATALVVQRCGDAVAAVLGDSARLVAALAADRGDAPMIARTLGRHAVPTTFATVTDRWSDGLDEAAAALTTASRSPVGLGGPSGDGRSFGAAHHAVVERFAARLGLPATPIARHGQRSGTAAVAGAWGLAASVIAKIGLDVVLLAQDDVGEVTEAAPGAGGSSSMPHKRNPVAAISARAAAMQAPGLVATLLHAAGSGELERAAGAWHAEWPALNGLLRATGSAAQWLHTSLGRLVVDPARMAANLSRSQEHR